MDGVIDYDAASEATGDKNLWTEKEYGDFVLRVDWRIKETPYVNPNVPIIRFDGTHKKGARRQGDQDCRCPTRDSGVYLRGSSKSQINIWCWPIGSGEVYGYRMDEKMPPEVRAGVTPRANADKRHRRVEHVRDHDEGRPAHGGPERPSRCSTTPSCPASRPRARSRSSTTAPRRTASWTSPPSLVQFRNISIKELR